MIFTALYAVAVLVIQPSFSALENQEINKGITQAMSTLNYRLIELEGKVKDYSFWDDTYYFVQDGNQDYTENNFVDETFENLNLNLIAIVNNSRSLMYYQSFDLNNSAKVQTSEEIKMVLTSDDCIWEFPSSEEVVSGIVLFDNKLMLVAASPILTSLNEGPTMGGMLFGKYLDEQEVNKLTEIMNLWL
jgi:sensor domain CHASE-containing protein